MRQRKRRWLAIEFDRGGVGAVGVVDRSDDSGERFMVQTTATSDLRSAPPVGQSDVRRTTSRWVGLDWRGRIAEWMA